MTQQINLLDPAFHKTFDWLTATPLAIATCAMLAIIAALTVWATMRADNRERLANQRAEALKTAQDRLITMTKSLAESKPNAQLANDLANARAMLKSREEIMKILDSGAVGSTVGFAEFFRGFARQTPNGLWLTGFTIGAGGNEMEIHGRMLNPASLPEYIRRLKTEKIFQGRSFASLTIQRPEDGKEKKSVSTPPAPSAKPSAPAAVSPPVAPSFVDFVLMPSISVPATPASASPQAAPSEVADPAALAPNILNQIAGTSSPGVNSPKAPEKKP